MQKRVLKHIFTLFFTITFLTPRIVDLHAFSHISEDDSPISCKLCDTIAYHGQFDLTLDGNSYAEDESQNTPSAVVVFTTYNSPQEKIVSPIFIYNKPPPFI